MKKLLILFIILVLSFNLYSQDYKRDVYLMFECITDKSGKMVCDERNVNYEFNINTTLSWFFLFDKKNNFHDKIVSMDIIGYNKVTDDSSWIYELISENGRKYNITLNERRGTLILFPIYSLDEKDIKVQSIILRFNNPTRI